ncbi:hypothetical protein ACWDUN_17580 [Mycobacterium sp. NPDC003323]
MTTTPSATKAPSKLSAALAWYLEINPIYRVVIRWVLIAGLTLFAFWDTFASLVHTTREGGIGGYVWTVPIVATLVAFGVARRKRTELPIHDRQTDFIVGAIGLGMALLIQAALLDRYALYFHILRLDLVACWLFVVSSSVMLFGLRPVIRFAWVWLLLTMVFSLPYYLVVVLLGGGKFAAGAATLLIPAIGTGIAVGRTYRRGFYGSLATWAVGFAVLIAIAQLFPNAPMLVYQQVPAISALCLVGITMYLLTRRGLPKRILDRKVEPLAAKQVWSSVPLVVVAAIALSLCPLPTETTTAPISRPAPADLVQGRPLLAPIGWTVIEQREYPQARRLYGDGAVLVRQYMLADSGNPAWDKLSRPRTVVVDSLVSKRPFSFGTYPARVFYGLTSARISGQYDIDLDMGVHGRLISVVDDSLLVTWNSVQFAWGDSTLAQRVSIFAVDNHEATAPFPAPSTSVVSNIRTLITLLFRGNAVLSERAPVFKDEDLLRTFSRGLVAAQFR